MSTARVFNDAQDIDGNTALHRAIESSDIDKIEELMKLGANPSIVNNRGESALQKACFTKNKRVFECFLNSANFPTAKWVDALKLMGSNCIINMQDVPSAVEYWKIALTARKTTKRLKLDDEYRPWTRYFNETEFRTEDELENVDLDPIALHIQAVLICERQLGPTNNNTCDGIRKLRSIYKSDQNYQSYYNLKVQKLYVVKNTHGPMCVLREAIKIVWALHMMIFESKTAFINVDDVVNVMDILADSEEKVEIFVLLYLVMIFNIILHLPKDSAQIIKIIAIVKKAIRVKNSCWQYLLHIAVRDHDDGFYTTDHPLSPYPSVVDLLLACGHEVNIFNDQKETPLHVAIEEQNLDMVKLLLRYGAHVDMKDLEGVEASTLLKKMPGLNFNPTQYLSLQCLAAKEITRSEIPYKEVLPARITKFVDLHV